MAKLSMETRKTRLLGHIYERLLEEGMSGEWIDELDAIQDVLHDNTEGMKYWTVTRDCELVFN